MAVSEWYIMDRGKIGGPYGLAQLESMRSQGALNSFARVSQDRVQWILLDDQLRNERAKAIAPAPIRPPALAGAGVSRQPGYVGTAALDDLHRPFPIFPLLLLHYLTGGLFTFFWTICTHGDLPKLKADDPSAGKALGLCFVPLFNLYWICVMYPRLAARVNARCAQYGLQPAVPLPLSYLLCACLVIPGVMGTAGAVVMAALFFSPTSKSDALLLFYVVPSLFAAIHFLIMAPLFAFFVQSGINQVYEAQLVLLVRSGRPEGAI
ncbi:MAG: hypothetical protein AB7O62_21960 [Pirellulales bacterium]